MKKLYRFCCDCGRMGRVESIFAAEEADVSAAIGQDVYFGEILGKHSQVQGTLGEEDFMLLTDDQDFIQKAEEYGIIPTGYPPLRYLVDEEEEE